jgi:hypothetical protein
MDKMLGSMMKGFVDGMSADDKVRMNACFEKMSSMCSCCNGKGMPEEEDKKTMMEKMQSFCGGKTE